MAATEAEMDDKDGAILDFVREQPGGFAGTKEVAEEFDMTTHGASYRLKKLRKHGKIECRNVSRDDVWYPATQTSADGLGAYGLSPGGFAPKAANAGITTASVSVVAVLLYLKWGPFFLGVAVLLSGFAVVCAGAVYKYRYTADPSFEPGDWVRQLREAKKRAGERLKPAGRRDSEK